MGGGWTSDSKRSSDDGVRCSAGVEGCDCGPAVTKDENCGADESGKPQSGSHQEVPTLQAGNGQTEVLKVTRIGNLVEL